MNAYLEPAPFGSILIQIYRITDRKLHKCPIESCLVRYLQFFAKSYPILFLFKYLYCVCNHDEFAHFGVTYRYIFRRYFLVCCVKGEDPELAPTVDLNFIISHSVPDP